MHASSYSAVQRTGQLTLFQPSHIQPQKLVAQHKPTGFPNPFPTDSTLGLFRELCYDQTMTRIFSYGVVVAESTVTNHLVYSYCDT